MITLLSAHSFRKCFNTGESKDMVRVFRSNFPSNLCYHETELCQLWRQQIDKVQLVLAIYVNFWNENAKKNPMFLKKKLKILWRGNRSLTHYLTPKICRSTLLASRGKLYTLAVKYSPYTCYSKHRENIDTRVIFPLVSRYTGALPPNTTSHNILQKGKTIVPQTVQQKRNR